MLGAPLTLPRLGAYDRQRPDDNSHVASSLAIRELSPATTAKLSLARVAAKESSITAAIARIASGRRAV